MTEQMTSKALDAIVTHEALLQIDSYRNVGHLDRIIRLIAGLAMIISVYFVSPESVTLGGPLEWWPVVPLLGIYPTMTAFLGWEPIYDLFDLDTNPMAADQYAQLRDALRREERRYHAVAYPGFA